MKTTIEMPQVSKCSVVKCAYNRNKNCHARAITIGDAAEPRCDTFFTHRIHTKEQKRIAGVGACKATECRHNEDFECVAKSITVGTSEGQVECLTYEPRDTTRETGAKCAQA